MPPQPSLGASPSPRYPRYVQQLGRSACVLAGLVALVSGCDPAPDPSPETEWEVGRTTDEDVGAYLSVWGSARTDVWALGGQPDTSQGDGFLALAHFDGTSWSDATPTGLGELPMQNWIYGVDGELWTVGERGVTLHSPGGSGDDWEMVPAPVDVPIWGVWGPAADDLWAVGGDATPGSGDPVLLHYTGGAWETVEVPELDRSCDALFKVWGTGPDQAFAVGDSGVILGWDGNTWAQVPSGTSSDLISLWGTGPDEIIAVGGRSNATVLRWDGSAWTSESLPGLPGLNGVWVDADGRATVVGILGKVATLEPGTYEFAEEDSNAAPMVLHAAFGLEDGARFSVGGTLDRSPPLSGIIVQYLP